MPKLHYLLPSEDVISAYGVTVRINPDSTVDIFGAKEMRFDSDSLDFKAKNIQMEAEEHMVLKSKRIDLNPQNNTTFLPETLCKKREFK